VTGNGDHHVSAGHLEGLRLDRDQPGLGLDPGNGGRVLAAEGELKFGQSARRRLLVFGLDRLAGRCQLKKIVNFSLLRYVNLPKGT
jgi:hypothetical protein